MQSDRACPQHQPAEAVAVFGGKAHRDSAAENLGHQNGWARTCGLDQFVEPAIHATGIEGADYGVRSTVARQIRGDYTMGLHKIGNHAQPFGRVFSRAVQQHNGRAVAAYQSCGRDAVELEPVVYDGQMTTSLLRTKADERFDVTIAGNSRHGS